MEESQEIIIISKEGTQITFDKRFGLFSTQVAEMDQNEPLPCKLVSEEYLLVIKEFLINHNFNPDTMQCQQPLKNGNLQDNIDKISFNVLKEFQGFHQIQKTKELLDASIYFGFDKLKDIVINILACEFYVGDGPDDIENLKQKFGIQDPSIQEQKQFREDFKELFDKIQNLDK